MEQLSTRRKNRAACMNSGWDGIRTCDKLEKKYEEENPEKTRQSESRQKNSLSGA